MHSAHRATMDAFRYGSGFVYISRALLRKTNRELLVGLALKDLTETAILKSICAEMHPARAELGCTHFAAFLP